MPARFEIKSLDGHRQALQPQFSYGAAIERREAGVGQPRLGKPRQQAGDRDRNGGSAKDIADAVMRFGRKIFWLYTWLRTWRSCDKVRWSCW